MKAFLRRTVKWAVERAAGVVDSRDVFCFGGIGCVGYGLAQIYVPAAWCAVGAALFWLSVRR